LALPLLYEFCEFFGIPANCVLKRRAEPRQKQLKRRYRRTQLPQRSFSSFRHRARSWPRQRRIGYKAEHSAGTNLRFVVTNCAGATRGGASEQPPRSAAAVTKAGYSILPGNPRARVH